MNPTALVINADRNPITSQIGNQAAQLGAIRNIATKKNYLGDLPSF